MAVGCPLRRQQQRNPQQAAGSVVQPFALVVKRRGTDPAAAQAGSQRRTAQGLFAVEQAEVESILGLCGGGRKQHSSRRRAAGQALASVERIGTLAGLHGEAPLAHRDQFLHRLAPHRQAHPPRRLQCGIEVRRLQLQDAAIAQWDVADRQAALHQVEHDAAGLDAVQHQHAVGSELRHHAVELQFGTGLVPGGDLVILAEHLVGAGQVAGRIALGLHVDRAGQRREAAGRPVGACRAGPGQDQEKHGKGAPGHRGSPAAQASACAAGNAAAATLVDRAATG